MTSTDKRLTAKRGHSPVSDCPSMRLFLCTTPLIHAQQGSDITEPTLLELLTVAGVLEERLTRLEAVIQRVTTT